MKLSDVPRLALSVRQPYAWCIAWGGKAIENRDWRPEQSRRYVKLPHRIAIAASAQTSGREYEAAEETAARFGQHGIPGLYVKTARDFQTELAEAGPADRHRDELVFGGIVAFATVVRVEPSPSNIRRHRPLHPWEFDNGYAWHLEDVVPVPFVRARGAHKLWEMPLPVRERLQRRIGQFGTGASA